MRRTLWQMTDDQVWRLRDSADALLHELYAEHTALCALLLDLREDLTRTARKSASRRQVEQDCRECERRIERVEAKIRFQRTFVREVDAEYEKRNPPLWSREDLDAIRRSRGES